MNQSTTPRKRKKRMRLPNGLGSVHRIGDGKNRRKPWRARVPADVDFNIKTGKANAVATVGVLWGYGNAGEIHAAGKRRRIH